MRVWLLVCAGLISGASCSGCQKKTEVSANTAEGFWQWVAGSETGLANGVMGTDPAHTMQALTERIKAVNPGLIAEVAIDRSTGAQQTLVISAAGNSALFPAVKALVASAPALARFKVVAFRQRRLQQDDSIEVEGKSYSTKDFFYRELDRLEGKLDIEILVKGLTAENNETMTRLAFVLLDAAVGEYDVETKLGGVTLVAMPAEVPEAAKPLQRVAEAVDSL